MTPEGVLPQASGIPTLYSRPGACALAPHIVLHWVAAEHVARRAERDDPELLAINPTGAAGRAHQFLIGFNGNGAHRFQLPATNPLNPLRN